MRLTSAPISSRRAYPGSDAFEILDATTFVALVDLASPRRALLMAALIDMGQLRYETGARRLSV